MKSIQLYQAVIKASAGFAVAAVALQLPANAAEQCTSTKASSAKSTSISVADLDLSTSAGVQAARARLHQAARKLCDEVLEPSSVSHQPDFVRCVDQAMAEATAQLEGPMLARRDVGKTFIDR
jgi:UrcA family protein